MANASVVDLDADFVCFRWCDLNILDTKLFASFPGHGGLARNGLSGGVRHGGQEESSVRGAQRREGAVL